MQSLTLTAMDFLMLLPLMLHVMPTTNNRLTKIPRNDTLPMLRVSSYFVLALCLHTMLWVEQAHQKTLQVHREEGEVPQSELARQVPVWFAVRCSRFFCTFCACAWLQQLNPSASLLLRHKGTRVTIKWRQVWSLIVSQWVAGLATRTQATPPTQQQSLVPALSTMLPTRWVDAPWRAALSLRAKVLAVDALGTTGLRKVPIGTRKVIFIYSLYNAMLVINPAMEWGHTAAPVLDLLGPTLPATHAAVASSSWLEVRFFSC